MKDKVKGWIDQALGSRRDALSIIFPLPPLNFGLDSSLIPASSWPRNSPEGRNDTTTSSHCDLSRPSSLLSRSLSFLSSFLPHHFLVFPHRCLAKDHAHKVLSVLGGHSRRAMGQPFELGKNLEVIAYRLRCYVSHTPTRFQEIASQVLNHTY